MPFDLLPAWVYQACAVLLVVGPFAGRALLVLCDAMGWIRLAASVRLAAPFARGFLAVLLPASPAYPIRDLSVLSDEERVELARLEARARRGKP